MDMPPLNATNTASIAPATESNSSASGSARAEKPALGGLDFGEFFQRQLQAVNSQKRQDFAARSQNDESHDNAMSEENHFSQKSLAEIKNHSETFNRRLPQSSNPRQPTQSAQSSQRANDHTVNKKQDIKDAQNQTEDTKDSDVKSHADRAPLKTIALSDKVQIVTTHDAEPDDSSLADFARTMGLDEQQIQNLLGAAQNATAPAPTPTPTTAQVLQSNTPLITMGQAPSDLNALAQLANSNITNSAKTLDTTNELGAKTLDTTNELGAKTQLFQALQNTTLELGKASLPPVTQEMANISIPSTLAVLSLMDAQLRPQDIEALVKSYEKNNSDESVNSIDTSNDSTPLQNTTSATSKPSEVVAAKAVAPTVAANLTETFEKLNQKLATEMAARIHQQLADGEWKMKFALKPASLGQVDVQLEMRDGKLSALFQTDNPVTQDLLQSGSQRLKDSLNQMGHAHTSVHVGQGNSQSRQGQSHDSSHPTEENHVKLATVDDSSTGSAAIVQQSNDSNLDIYA
ncbi:MAG: flagellar hook-length control protein FliK [Burkholderiaceae bacterium]